MLEVDRGLLTIFDLPKGPTMQRRFTTFLRAGAVLLAASLSMQAAALNACDLIPDGVVNAADVDLAIKMSTGATKPCTANIIGSGVCNVVMVQRVINAARGASCGHTATLAWVASVSPNVAGYKIYRSIVNGSSYTLLTATPVTGTTYVDGTVQGGLTYYYVVTAIDANNNASGYSNQATAVVPSP
jgi:hypothetical protein